MAPREIKITNTLSRQKEVFKPRVPGKVTFYSCGPTVYGFIHIGNLRGGLVADMMARYLRKVGYQVTYARNYTDIDDKIITKGIEEGTSADAVAKRYTQEVEKDYAVAGMKDPDLKPKATEHVPEMIEIIQKIIANGKAYVAPDGEVIYSVRDFDGYGKLSKKKLDENEAGARVEVSGKKKDPADFTLWKPAKPGEPSWESPWGPGRPGWHIECSAMIHKHMGDQIDLHHGGEDLIFPHHENEIAQTEGASGKDPFVGYWVHHAFLTLSKEKMSKSLGNVFTARDFLTKYSGEVARYMLLGQHYRSMIDFSQDTVDQALTGLHRIYEAKARAVELMSKKTAMSDLRAENAWGEFVADCEKVRKEIDDAFADDFNTPRALGSLFTLIREFNRVLGTPKAEGTPAVSLASHELVRVIEGEIGAVIGIGLLDPKKALSDINRIRGELGGSDEERISAEEIEKKIAERLAARKAKDFARSDAIRDELLAKGVAIKDSPQGTTWAYK